MHLLGVTTNTLLTSILAALSGDDGIVKRLDDLTEKVDDLENEVSDLKDDVEELQAAVDDAITYGEISLATLVASAVEVDGVPSEITGELTLLFEPV